MPDSLVIEAEATWEFFEGNQGALTPFIIARVKDRNGEPVTELKKSNFQVIQMGFDFKRVNLLSPNQFTGPTFEELSLQLGILPGTYKLRLNLGDRTRDGQLVFALVVTGSRSTSLSPSSRAKGQALVSVIKLR